MNSDYALKQMEKEAEVCFPKFEKVITTLLNNKTKENIIETKNKFVREIVNRQLKECGFFSLIFPYKNVCRDCHGYGQIFQFKKPIEIFCDRCEGIGIYYSSCHHCDGSGKKVEIIGDKTCTSPCKHCKGTGYIEKKCVSCRGNGVKKKLISMKHIQNFTICRRCGGKGFVEKRIDDPVIKKEDSVNFKPKWVC